MSENAEALYLLAFDHRGSFQKKLLGIAGEPTEDEAARIREAKGVIFAGFREALESGLPLDGAGILVDEQFGAEIARAALGLGAQLAMPVVIRECQQAGVEPDIWKIEGLDARDDCSRLAEAAQAGGRDHVRCVVLGRGGDESKVVHWLETGAGVPGFVGFAVGRTIWWDPLEEWLAGASADETAETIAANYRRLVDAYAAAGSPLT